MNRKRLAIVSALALGTAVPSFAIFGVGDIVIDLTQAAHAIQQIGQFETMISSARQNLEVAKQNVLALAHKETYRRLLTNALHQAQTDSATYGRARLPLTEGVEAPATVTLSDSAAENTVALLNQIVQSRNANRASVDRWTNAVSSGDPNANTAAALAGLTNTGLVNLYAQQEQTLAVNSAIAQSLMLQNMRARNEEVAALNAQAEQRKAFASFHVGDVGGALMNLRSR